MRTTRKVNKNEKHFVNDVNIVFNIFCIGRFLRQYVVPVYTLIDEYLYTS